MLIFASVPGYVRSVQVTGQSDTSSIVQWMPPLYPNGVITRYRLIFTNSISTVPRNVTVDGNVMTYGVTNLGVLIYTYIDMYIYVWLPFICCYHHVIIIIIITSFKTIKLINLGQCIITTSLTFAWFGYYRCRLYYSSYQKLFLL